MRRLQEDSRELCRKQNLGFFCSMTNITTHCSGLLGGHVGGDPHTGGIQRNSIQHLSLDRTKNELLWYSSIAKLGLWRRLILLLSSSTLWSWKDEKRVKMCAYQWVRISFDLFISSFLSPCNFNCTTIWVPSDAKKIPRRLGLDRLLYVFILMVVFHRWVFK